MTDEMTPAEAARVAAMAANMVPTATDMAPSTPPVVPPASPTDTPDTPDAAPAAGADDPDARYRSILDGINARIEQIMGRLRDVEAKVTDKIGEPADEPLVDPTTPNDAPDQMDPVDTPERGATPL